MAVTFILHYFCSCKIMFDKEQRLKAIQHHLRDFLFR